MEYHQKRESHYRLESVVISLFLFTNLKLRLALDLKNNGGAVYKGSPKTGKADCSLTIDEDCAIGVFEGREDAMKVSIQFNRSVRLLIFTLFYSRLL